MILTHPEQWDHEAGAEATITLPGRATAGSDMSGKAAKLRLRTVNGNTFEVPVKAG
jgi:hypothetical protein